MSHDTDTEPECHQIIALIINILTTLLINKSSISKENFYNLNKIYKKYKNCLCFINIALSLHVEIIPKC